MPALIHPDQTRSSLLALKPGEFLILGSSAGADIRLTADGVAPRHARIAQEQGAVSGSLNLQHTADGVFIFLAAIGGFEAGLVRWRPPEPETYTVLLPAHILLATQRRILARQEIGDDGKQSRLGTTKAID